MLRAILFRPVYRGPGWTHEIVRTTRQPPTRADWQRAWYRQYPKGKP